mgnify:CR=1 FL=1
MRAKRVTSIDWLALLQFLVEPGRVSHHRLNDVDEDLVLSHNVVDRDRELSDEDKQTFSDSAARELAGSAN